jgi:hypothetical protein
MLDEVITRKWPAETTWSLATSLLLHALLLFAAASMWTARPPPPFEEVIPVDLLIAPEGDMFPPPAAPEGTRPEEPDAAPPEAVEPLMHAANILSGRALANPRNRQALADLPKIEPTERMIQLCNIEALEQLARLHKDFSPEMVDAHATRELAFGPNTVLADGAAFRSGDDWYGLRYRCRLSPGHDVVVTFDFLAGEQLSAERIEKLGLAIGK